ncbi:Fc.00g022390.m01.CDS01 [Cosmosporella sp. VM-42]
MLLATNPDINLGTIVPQGDFDTRTQLPSSFPTQEGVAESEASQSQTARSRASTPGPCPLGPGGFDWGKAGDDPIEDPENISISTEGAGYLGKFTSVALLRTLYTIGCFWRNAPIRPPTCPPHLHLTGEYSNIIPWEALERSDSSEGFADFLIDAYFRHFHTTYPLLHEATFRAQYNEVIPRPPEEAWSLLTRSVFAIGAWSQVEFHLMINNAYNECINNPDLPAKDLLSINAKIDAWVESLPPHLQEDSAQSSFPRLNFASHHLLWRVRGLKIVLFFPTFVHLTRSNSLEANSDPEIRNRKEAACICVGYAHTIIISIERFFAKEASNPLRDWYARHCLIQSALVLILALQTNFDFLQDCRPTLIADFEKMKILLAKVSDEDRFARIIQDIMNQVLMSPSQRDFVGTATSFSGEEFVDLLTLPLDEQVDPWLWSLWGEMS